MKKNLKNELARHVRNKNYEPTEAGIYIPKAGINIGGVFTHDILHPDGSRAGAITDHNLVVNEGLDALLDIMFHNDTQISTWYVGLFSGDYTPQATDTAANITANATEFTGYDEATRVEYNEAAASSQSITNSANTADFTINSGATIYGAFLVSASAKSATTGTLFSASRFSTSRVVASSDSLQITYTVTASDA